LKTVAREVAHDGVTVNTVQPGMHLTGRITQLYGAAPDASAMGIPAGVMGDPDDFGHVVTFLCSDHAKFVTGVQMHVDGGAYGGLL
jgi:3-oxoacyl-[acyl-carrier protein] reductase